MMRAKWWLESKARKHIAESIWVYLEEPGEYLLRNELFYLAGSVYPSAAKV